MKKLYLIAVFALGFVHESLAQQDPHYTQYMYNMNVVNPAYAGSKENLTIGLLYRQQWVGLDGAPTTGTLSASSPIGKNAGLGLSFITDQIGPVQENNIYADYAYTLRLGGDHRLAFGLKAGVTMHQVGLFSDVDPSLPQPNDPAFHENTSRSYLNIGSGIFYYTNKYYVGLSVPNMMKSTHLQYKDPDDANAVEQEFGTDVSHYFLTGGYVFDVNDKVKFKPFFMLKSAFNVQPSLDLSTNFLFNDKFEVGATYRMEDSFGAMLGYRVTPNIRLGYAYDHVISDLNITSPSSHEFIALFDLNFPKKVSRSPRYF